MLGSIAQSSNNMSTDSNDGSPSSFGCGSFSIAFGRDGDSVSPSIFSFLRGTSGEGGDAMNVWDNLFVGEHSFDSLSLSDGTSNSGGGRVHFTGEIASSSGSGSGGDLSNSSGQESATTDTNNSSVKAGEIVHADANNASIFTSAASEAALGVGGDTLLDLTAGVQKFNTETTESKFLMLGKICEHLKTNHSSRHHHHGKMKLSDFVGNGKGRLTYKQVIADMYGKQEDHLEVKRTTKSMRTFIKNIRRSPSNNKQNRREIYENLPLDVLSTT